MNDGDISLRHLRVLGALLEVRSLTKVADILDTSQPSISKMLARLREHFGDPLFVRVGLSMHPTPRAAELAESLRSLLAVSDQMHDSAVAFDAASSKRQFRIAVSEAGMVHLVPPLMQALAQAGRDLRLKAVPLDSRHVSARLESGEADIAFGAFPRQTGSLRRQKLYADPYVCVARRDHPRLRSMSRLEVFRRERHILVTASSAGHAAHGQLEREMQLQLDADLAQVSVPSFVACAFLASRSDAIGILPSKLADYLICDLPLAQFKPPISLPRIEISQIWHERVNRDPAHRWLRSTIFDLFRPGRRGSKAQT